MREMGRESIGGDKTGLYKENFHFLIWQNELDIVFSLMTDKELLEMNEKVGVMKEEVYKQERFPLSCEGIEHLQATIMFSFWVRKGRGVKIEDGEIVACELKESPFWERYQAPDILEDSRTGERYVEGERECEPEVEQVDEGEDKGEWV